jgi:hypothetical protein
VTSDLRCLWLLEIDQPVTSEFLYLRYMRTVAGHGVEALVVRELEVVVAAGTAPAHYTL